MQADAFFPLVLPEVIGCPDPTLIQAIMLTAHSFCTETGVWDEVQDPVLTSAGIADYEIDAPANAEMLRVRSVWLDGRELEPNQMRTPVVPNFGTPLSYHAALARGQITLDAKPQAKQSLVVRAVYAPRLTGQTLPDFLMSRYALAIASGAKARLMLIPGQAWSNPTLSQFYAAQYQDAVINARIDMERDNVGGSLRVKPRPFFQGRP